MDENWAWKTVYIAVFFSLLILGIALFLISPRESTYFTRDTSGKMAEFKNTYVQGRKEGKKSWEFFARSGYTERNQDISHLYDVSRGHIYKDGKLLVTDLRLARRSKRTQPAPGQDRPG